MHKFTAILALACLLLAAPAGAAWKFQRHDCNTSNGVMGFITDYSTANLGNVVGLVGGLVPVIKTDMKAAKPNSTLADVPVVGTELAGAAKMVSTLVPGVQGWFDSKYVGIGVDVAKVYVGIGGSPVGGLNVFLGFFCTNLVDVPADGQ